MNRNQTKSEHIMLRKLPALGAAGAGFALYQALQQSRFKVTRHKYLTAKASSFVRIVSLADLHDHQYGPVNRELLDTVDALRPDAIVIPGDFFTRRKRRTKQEIPASSVRTMLMLAQISPVFYSFGNHETHILEDGREQAEQFCTALDQFRSAGVHVLRNERILMNVNGTQLEITGFEPDRAYYFKGTKVSLRDGYLEKTLGDMLEPQALQILLAHAPAYFESYAKTDTDIVFSGHTHGGLVRIPGVGSVISPELTLFPDYDKSAVSRNGTTMYVSRGLGTHTVHLRVFDPAEIVVTDVKPLVSEPVFQNGTVLKESSMR